MAGMITCLILIPVAGALAVSLAPQAAARTVALMFNALTFLLGLFLWHDFNATQGGVQLVERHEWIRAIGAEYLVGMDGLSLLLVLLTSIAFPFAFFAQKPDRSYCAFMLIMQAALYGTFTAQNFVLWFLFYEMSLMPAFLLIKLWGGVNRDYAATKFFVYTFLGSVTLLLAFLAIYLVTGTFDFAALAGLGANGGLASALASHFHTLAWLVFAGVFIGFAVKVPLFPFHMWLPDAYSTAPVGVSMVLTGILSKMGVYGFARLLLPLFPHEMKTLGPWLLSLAVCSIVISSLAALAQTDLKRMVSYLSINHLGYCMLGLFAVGASSAGGRSDISAAFSGVFMQIFNHGITAAALFYYVGLLEKRTGGRDLAAFGGLMQLAPLFCGWMSLAMFSSMGLPGLNGFIGEFLIFKGAFSLAPVASACAVAGLLVTTVVLLRTMQTLFSGPAMETRVVFPDLSPSEIWTIVPVSLLMVGIGVAPQFMLNLLNATVLRMAHPFT